ncbi:hypothetical protein [Actinosynnema pretiosum]|uniref:hypothetical protein n=1 Tax=Actinosynnema pretiosum TaxID=42197 RepID=UPI0012FD9A20|nr:hypothetical protein [Actinosynnema pretiosum]
MAGVDSTSVRAHRHAAGARKKEDCADWIEDLAVDGECLGRSRGELTTRLRPAVDSAGLPPVAILTPGQAGDNPQPQPLLDDIHDIDVDGRRVRGAAGDHRQGLRPSGRPHRVTAAADQGHHPGTCRPDRPPQGPGLDQRQANEPPTHRAEIILACIALHLR